MSSKSFIHKFSLVEEMRINHGSVDYEFIDSVDGIEGQVP